MKKETIRWREGGKHRQITVEAVINSGETYRVGRNMRTVCPLMEERGDYGELLECAWGTSPYFQDNDGKICKKISG
jgi:hypothetical protein